MTDSQDFPNYYVAVGASAGGLEALQTFFQHMPVETGAAFIIIQHLSPDFKSMMAELLGRHTSMPVHNAVDGVVVEANTLYLIPPRRNMMIAEGKLILVDQMPDTGVNFPIDIFFRSIAEDQHHRTIGIILSGTGSDGSRGIQAIKEVGGLVIVQEPSSAGFDGMPYSAVKTGVADVVISPDKMASKLVSYINHPMISGQDQSLLKSVEDSSAALSEIYGLLKEGSEIDFAKYKTSTVARRIERRIGINQLGNLREYYALLLRSPQEVQTLAKDMLIGVTRFFRDPENFDQLEKLVIPQIIETVPRDEPIRVWVAGCSTGEEAYSIAILFDEAIRESKLSRSVKIFATDVDPDAIAEASTGQFSISLADDIGEERLKTYFLDEGDHLTVKPSLRQMVVFATHNLIKDPPFSNTQLVICRNVLIYFQQEAQRKVLSMLHFSLQREGFLFLGASESLGDLRAHFEVLHDRSRIYRKVTNSRALRETLHEIPGRTPHSNPPSVDQLLSAYKRNQKSTYSSLLVDHLLEDYVPPCLLLDENFEVLHLYGDLSLFTRKPKSGKFSSDVKDIIVDELAVAVSTALHRSKASESNVQYNNVRIKDEATDSIVAINLRAIYIKNSSANANCFILVFDNVQSVADTENNLALEYDQDDQSRQRIHDLETELQQKQEHLQVTVEELETTNEELQSSNEELLAANEELQSTNEELQSVNEELYTVNSEYQEKIDQLMRANSDIDNIMKSTNIGIIFLDQAMLIRNFTPAATREFNLLESDIGRPFHHIAHNLNYQNLLSDLAKVLDNHKPIEMEISTKVAEKVVLIKITPYFNENQVAEGVVIVFSDVSEIRLLQTKLKASYQALRTSVGTALTVSDKLIKVLIFDDSEADRTLIRSYLENAKKSNYEIFEADSEAEATAILENEGAEVCLIDFRLMEENAFQYIQTLRTETELDPAFIMMSGLISDELYERAIELGIYHALNKEDLSTFVLDRCIRYTLLHKETESYLDHQT